MIHLSPLCGLMESSWVQLRLYAHLSVSLSIFTRLVLVIICADLNCVQRMRPQVFGSNPLSDSMIFLSIRLSVFP